MNLRVVTTILRKELVDLLRDKRTLILMVGVPIVLYPVLFIFGSQAAVIQRTRIEKAVFQVGIPRDADPTLKEWLKRIPQISVQKFDDAESNLRQGKLEAVVVSEGNLESRLASGESVPIEVRYDATDVESQEAATRIAEGLKKEQETLLQARLAGVGLKSDYVQPLKVERKNVASSAKATGTVLGMILGVIMVIMLGLGAFYPAIDLTAGEKERGTFETLLSTPATKHEIVTGKFLTVLCLSLLTGLLNLGSMVLTFAFQLGQLKNQIGQFEIDLPPHVVATILVVLTPLAFFISAIMMSIAVFARSFKEAQNFMTPFFTLLMFPAILAAIPGTTLTTATQLVPVMNVSLLFKDLLIGQATAQGILAVLVSTTVYALLALAAAVWVFQREEVILSQERGLPLTLRRGEFVRRRLPTPGMVLTLFAASLILVFYAGTYAQSRSPHVGLLITEWLLIFLPVILFFWYTRVDIFTALSLRIPSLTAALCSIAMGFAVVIFSLQLSVWQNQVFPIPDEIAKQLEQIVKVDQAGLNIVVLIAVAALSPAICEETLFRGAILSGVRQILPPWTTWIAVGALFGVFHISLHRMLITGLLGVFLTYLVWRSDSLFTGMIAHFIVNATSILAVNERLPAPMLRWFDEKQLMQYGMPPRLLAAAGIILILGIVMLEWEGRHRRENDG
ncbi:MAG: CPBP family intramembrane metalloprotease [Candidatus Hydrogenedentes bacterium]|nr:CPBP family intramembrane metalloprotease [Candidatus Hydrogenedentota bacterium]